MGENNAVLSFSQCKGIYSMFSIIQRVSFVRTPPSSRSPRVQVTQLSFPLILPPSTPPKSLHWPSAFDKTHTLSFTPVCVCALQCFAVHWVHARAWCNLSPSMGVWMEWTFWKSPFATARWSWGASRVTALASTALKSSICDTPMSSCTHAS